MSQKVAKKAAGSKVPSPAKKAVPKAPSLAKRSALTAGGSRPNPKKPAGTAGRGAQRSALRRFGVPILIVAAIVAGLAAIFVTSQSGKGTGSTAAAAGYQVGSPGPGAVAPPISLASTTGGTFSLAAQRGKTVLLYFQEGLTCQPCWDQLKAIDTNLSAFQVLGVSQVISITTDPLGALKQKVADEGITTPVLSDPNLAVSSAYSANQYGMMGNSADGHSFIAVGPNGKILWRADFGGAPNYTMYVPVANLVSDLRAGLGQGG